jgi:hypothetical protein
MSFRRRECNDRLRNLTKRHLHTIGVISKDLDPDVGGGEGLRNLPKRHLHIINEISHPEVSFALLQGSK